MDQDDDLREATAKFGNLRPTYVSFANQLETLLRSLIENSAVKCHLVESRAKTIESFRDKIGRPGKDYTDPLNQIDDLCGCRIITYYLDDVQTASNIIKSEFEVIEEELSHQPNSLDADRFGYISAHYVIKLKKNRAGLLEWKAFAGLKAEVQVRTVIQHAWSAVSHAIHYKQETSVPSALQRRLFRIAGLFELADEEFIGIRDQRNKLQQETVAAIASGNLDIPLSPSSILEAIRSWSGLPDARKAARAAGFRVMSEERARKTDDRLVSQIYDVAQKIGINSIDELIKNIDPPKLDYFLEVFSKKETDSHWNVSDTFIFLMLLLAKNPSILTQSYFDKWGWSEKVSKRFVNPSDA